MTRFVPFREQVFSSLSIISENWASVNDFRSVAIRLSEFEHNLYNGRPPASSTRRGSGGIDVRDTNSRDCDLVVVDGEPPSSASASPAELTTTDPDYPTHIEMHLTSTYGRELNDMRI